MHGNEPGHREACLILARELAFSHDRRTVDLLRDATVLIVPTVNGDGRAANTRGNSTGQDLNRDYSLIRQPETFAYVQMLRDYRPVAAFDGHEFGNPLRRRPARCCRRATRTSPSSIFDQSQDMIESHMYAQRRGRRLVALPVRLRGRRRVGPQRGDDPAQHAGPEERHQLAAGAAHAGRPDPARRGQRGQQPAPQELTRRCGRSTSSSTTTTRNDTAIARAIRASVRFQAV